jgi:hypothetical protein
VPEQFPTYFWNKKAENFLFNTSEQPLGGGGLSTNKPNIEGSNPTTATRREKLIKSMILGL